MISLNIEIDELEPDSWHDAVALAVDRNNKKRVAYRARLRRFQNIPALKDGDKK